MNIHLTRILFGLIPFAIMLLLELLNNRFPGTMGVVHRIMLTLVIVAAFGVFIYVVGTIIMLVVFGV